MPAQQDHRIEAFRFLSENTGVVEDLVEEPTERELRKDA
jgi:hypothetical protein